MRQIGKRREQRPAFSPSAESLRLSRIHQHAAQSLAAVSTTGIRKGIYRFATHDEMNKHAEEALALAIAANVRHREARDRRRR